MTYPVVNALWIGPQLGPVQVACLKSFVRQGYRVVLHVYERPSDAPKEIELADAAETLPKSAIFGHAFGSYAVFSDIFRYELLSKNGGLYVDCDVFCLKPLEESDYIFGWVAGGLLGNGVIALPIDCPMLRDLRQIRDGFIPPWYRKAQKFRMRLGKALGIRYSLAESKWTNGPITGPAAFTWYARHHRVIEYALPFDVLNPVRPYDFRQLFDIQLCLSDIITPRTRLIHIYNSQLQRHCIDDIPKGSPIDELLEKVD